jgi:ubiquinone biosynthesis protein Coq4
MKKQLLRLRTRVLIILTHRIALPVLKLLRKPVVTNCSKEQLAVYPPGSLGHDLYLFLHKRNLPFMQHYVRHDLKHVLLEYDTTDEGEACLQSFMLGNGRISFPVLATVMYAFITMPEYWYTMKAAYRQGRQCASFHGWIWNELLTEPTIVLRNKIFTKNK